MDIISPSILSLTYLIPKLSFFLTILVLDNIIDERFLKFNET